MNRWVRVASEWPMLRTALVASTVVGLALSLINDAIDFGGGRVDVVRVGLNFAVPFVVSLVAGVLATCRERDAGGNPC